MTHLRFIFCNTSITELYNNQSKLEISGRLLQNLYQLRQQQPQTLNYSNKELIQYYSTNIDQTLIKSVKEHPFDYNPNKDLVWSRKPQKKRKN